MSEIHELPLVDVAHERADAQRNREAILAAAERLLSCGGVGELTMDEVATAAGVGKGTLFRRFEDRAGLLRALLDESERRFQDEFIRGAPPLGPGAPAVERLSAFGHRVIRLVESRGDLLAAAERGGEPGVRLRHAVYGAYRTHVTTLLRECAAERDIDYLADALLSTLTADVVLYQLRVREMPLERLRDGWQELVETLCASDQGRR